MNDLESQELMHSNFRKAGISFLVLFVFMILLGVYFEPQVESLALWTYNSLGLFGLSAIVFANDALISPLPGDTALVVISRSPLAESWLWVVLLFGVVSMAAGFVGHFIGAKVVRLSIVQRFFARDLKAIEDKFKKHGQLILILGAATPVPYSMTTWVAGAMGYPRSLLWFPTLLRIPRFIVVYLILIKADWLSRFFNS